MSDKQFIRAAIAVAILHSDWQGFLLAVFCFCWWLIDVNAVNITVDKPK